MSFRRAVLGIGLAALLAVSVASPAFAYGQANWQTAFAGTGTSPTPNGTIGFGFWGWCAFGGGVTSGSTADCEFAQYSHGTTPSFTCHESINGTAWDISNVTGDFVIESGTITVTPTGLTQACLALFPGGVSPTTTISNVDSGVPAHAGHYDIGSIFGAHGEFQIQVTQI
jgi:hypothetical protein